MKTRLPSTLVAATVFVGLVCGTTAHPVIVTQPKNQTNRLGETATFAVEATGSPLPSTGIKYR